jgi:hypothetical protein
MNMEPQHEHMSKQELLAQIRSERGFLDGTLARLTHSQMLIPGVDGIWSVKDALAHISTWERRMISWVGSHLRGEPPAIPLPWDVDRMNAESYALDKDKPLSDVLEEFRLSYWDSLALVESLSEDQLQQVYSETWPMGPIWTGIADNMNTHYRDHRLDILKWLESQKKVR